MVTKKQLREQFEATILRDSHDSKDCSLCLSLLEKDKNDRGIVEFKDGWYWICSSCRKVVGKIFDLTQCSDYAEWEVIRYSKRSRNHWVIWLSQNYEIDIYAK